MTPDLEKTCREKACRAFLHQSGWGKAKRKKNHNVSVRTGHPFDYANFLDFAQKYMDEARRANVEYCPDSAAIRVRILKAASCLVRALEVHGQEDDAERIAGVSSAKHFPILGGGLATFEMLSDEEGNFDPGKRESLAHIKPDAGY